MNPEVKLNKAGTLSTGRVKQATTAAATRRSRKVILRAEVHEKDMVVLVRSFK